MSAAGRRVVVLGGAGEVGRWVSVDLAACPEIGELVIADVDGGRADALAASIGDPRLRAEAVDLGERERMLALLDGADLLMNCTSLVLFERVIELAIEARVNYADLISEPTDAQREAAARAGIVAISGLGSSPGLSNVLAHHAADDLEELEEIHIQGVTWRAIAPSPGLLDTILWELADDAPTRQYFQNGRWHRAAAFDGSREATFPEPVGRHQVYFVSHTETATLPRHFPQLKFCGVRVSWPQELMDDVRVLNKYGLLDKAPLPDAGGVTAYEATRAAIWARHGGRRSEPCILFTQVEAIGRRGGGSVRRVYDLTHPVEWRQDATGRQTGICAGVGAQLIARHGVAEAGFVDPEAYFDPVEFIEELRGRGTLTLTWRDEEIA
ncbi:MAG: saccharopine dehydrogenase NADP-binding domain-containing protein [Actinobacteria bacterium]|nr:saccharopine dehydrogenase NADP-binding domain-containing protein [Actinomycetota bacterium]